jgi:hypothetical protein
LYVPRKWGRRGLMKLEEAYLVNDMKMKEYVDSKEHKLSSVTKRITERNKTKDSIAQKTKKDGKGGECMDISLVT